MIKWCAVGRQCVGTASGFVIVDENYEVCGLWSEFCAISHKEEVGSRFERIYTKITVPFARAAEDAILLGVQHIIDIVTHVMEK